jgi:hypothetical protein
MSCDTITPISAFQSTNLNSKIDSFHRLGERIVRSLGAPLVSVEVSQDQLYENISIACEMFSKFAGFTKEYLIFDSSLYERGKGIRIDTLYTLANKQLSLKEKISHTTESHSTSQYLSRPDTEYVCITPIDKIYFSLMPDLSSYFPDGVFQNQIFDFSTYNSILTSFSTNQNALVSSVPVSGYFKSSYSDKITIGGEESNSSLKKFNNMFDYDIMDYRRVVAITDFEEGTSAGLNTLFTIEQTLAQQTYFSYAMGNYGFDLISWWTVKNWLETREKVLAIRRSYEFDDRTQYLRLYPEPTNAVRFYGVFPAYVERPLRDIIKELWVYKYSLALTKINVGLVRGKLGSTSVLGGQIFSQDLIQQGITERDALEQQLYTTSAGLGDSDPVTFFIG